MRSVHTATSLAALALIGLVAGCSNDVETKVSTGEAAKAPTINDEKVSADIEEFLNAQASQDPDQLRAFAAKASAGSIAQTYAEHQANIQEAALDSGVESPVDSSPVRDGDSYKICTTNSTTDCTVYGGFETATDGKLSAFTVKGRSLRDRLAKGSGKAVKIGGDATITLLTVYKSSGDDLWATFEVKTGDEKLSLNASQAKFINSAGKQRQPSTTYTSTDVAANSSTLMAIAFPQASAPGKIVISGSRPDSGYKQFDTTIKVG